MIPVAHPRTIPPLILSAEERADLDRVARSRTAPVRAVTRARVLTAYADGASCPTIARTLGIPLPTVMRGVKKALALGPRRALEDLPRAGRPPRITPEARAWIISLACQKPKDLGWAPEFWSEALLARYVREHAVEAGHPSARQVAQGTISQRLAAQDWHPPSGAGLPTAERSALRPEKGAGAAWVSAGDPGPGSGRRSPDGPLVLR